MNGCILCLVISMLWIMPTTTASASISTTAIGQGMFWLAMKSTNSTPMRTIIKPTVSSMPPVRLTIACPSADSPNMPTRLAVLAILIGSRKRGLMTVTTALTTRISRSRKRSFLFMFVSSRAGCPASMPPGRSPGSSRRLFDRLADGQPHYVFFAEPVPAEDAGNAALVHDGDAIGYADDFFHVG